MFQNELLLCNFHKKGFGDVYVDRAYIYTQFLACIW